MKQHITIQEIENGFIVEKEYGHLTYVKDLDDLASFIQNILMENKK